MLAELRESGNCNRSAVMEEKRQDDFFFREAEAARGFLPSFLGRIWGMGFSSGAGVFSSNSQRSRIGHSQHFGFLAVQQ